MDLFSRLEAAAERFPHAEALVEGGLRLDYGELQQRAVAVAGHLAAAGVEPGSRVLVVLKNRWENVVLYWACQRLGAVYTPLNFRASPEEIAYCIQDAEPVVIVHETERQAAVEAAVAQTGTAAVTVAVGAGGEFARWLQPGGPAPRPALDEHATAIMLYTSGTTGRPKGVPRSHRAEASAAVAHIVQNQYAFWERTVGVMPFYHTMGMRTLLSMTFLNGTLILMPDYDTAAMPELLARERVSCLYLVPTLYFDLVQQPLDRYDLRALRKIGYAGAAMTAALTEQCWERLQPQVFVNHFGSSEVYTFTVCWWLDRKPGCAGRAGLHEEVRVVQADAEGKTGPEDLVGPGEVGEVIVSLNSPEAFGGYWKRPDANARALRGGWYFTGDLGRWDDEGDLWVLGRVDDMLISGGENIHPLEVEEVLARHPKVLEVAVAGTPHPRWGQVVTAFVVPREPVSATELDQYCLASPQLARFKRPRRYVWVAAIPKSPVGKILRRKLQAGEYLPWPGGPAEPVDLAD